MKIFLVLFSVIVVAAVVAVAAVAVTKRHGAGEVQHETRSVSGFSRIEVSGLAEITLRQGRTEAVSVEAPAETLPRIRTEVRNRTLIVNSTEQRRWWDWFGARGAGRTPRIVIDLINLEQVESAGAIKLGADTLRAESLRIDSSGASSIKIADLQAKSLRIEGSGAIKAQLAGKVGTQVVDISGAGSYQAAGLVSDKADVRVSGAGKAAVNASTSLKVDISGAGIVEYEGDPKIEQTISGVGKVRRRDRD